MTHRPQCVACGDRYGQRNVTYHTVHWPKGSPIPPYTGPGKVTQTAQPYRQLSVLSGDPAMFSTERTIWDGESWLAPYQPFCTLRCALKYARKAYNATQEARV